MTGYQLRDTVCALGFTSDVPNDNAFFLAANLALSRLRTLIPVRKTVRIRSCLPKPSDYREYGESFSLHSPCGIGFCFEYIGSVTLSYSHGSDVFKEVLVNASPRYKSFSRVFGEKAPITLEVDGESAHCVVNACIYDNVAADGDIHLFSKYFSYDMRNEEGFMGILSVTGGEYSLCGSEIRIPRDSEQEYTVEYSYRPQPLSYDSLGERIGIDPCLYEAAALLTAYYVWMDDDAQKAKNYRAEYDAAVKEILKRRQVEISGVGTNCW